MIRPDRLNRKIRECLLVMRHIPKTVIGIWEVSGSLVVISLVLRLLLAGMPALVLWISKLLIDTIVQDHTVHATEHSRVWIILGFEFAVITLTDVLSRLAGYYDGILSDKFSLRLNTKLLEHADTLDLESFENPLYLDRLERTRTQTSAQLAVLTSLAQLVQTVAGLLILCGAVALYAPWLLGLQLVSVLPIAILDTYFATIIHRLYHLRTPMRRTMDYLVDLGVSFTSVKEIKAFGLGKYLISEYARLGEHSRSENIKVLWRRSLIGMILGIIGSAIYYAGYAYLVWKVVQGAISIGTLVFIGGSFQRSKWQMQEMFMTLSRTFDQAMHLGDIFDFFQMKPRVQNRPNGLKVQKPIVHGFEFRNVSFTYAGSSVPALSNVSFRLLPNETIALVGSNGAGKTTLTKLLARLYEPTEGVILLDGIDLRDYDLESVHNAISVVYQDFVRYEFTAGTNIGFGNINFKDDQDRLDRAAEAGMATPVIDRLPERYQQLVGKRFEGGIDLSGGEWQKLALSRGYMRDAALLILDEPSSALDARNEFALFQHFSKLVENRMAVLISHRLATVRMAHKILVMRSGRLVEQGTHESLMAQGGEYATLFNLQAAGYQEDYLLSRKG